MSLTVSCERDERTRKVEDGGGGRLLRPGPWFGMGGVQGYSRAVEGVDVAVGGFLLDVGRDDGWVWDAGGVQTVVGGHHVWGEPGGQKTV